MANLAAPKGRERAMGSHMTDWVVHNTVKCALMDYNFIIEPISVSSIFIFGIGIPHRNPPRLQSHNLAKRPSPTWMLTATPYFTAIPCNVSPTCTVCVIKVTVLSIRLCPADDVVPYCVWDLVSLPKVTRSSLTSAIITHLPDLVFFCVTWRRLEIFRVDQFRFRFSDVNVTVRRASLRLWSNLYSKRDILGLLAPWISAHTYFNFLAQLSHRLVTSMYRSSSL